MPRFTSRLQELVAIHRPGEQVEVVLLRNGKEKKVKATLKNTAGTISVVERVPEEVIDGTIFEEITSNDKERLGIDSGVKIADLGEGKWRDAGFEEGFIITHIDKQEVANIDNLRSIMAEKDNERVVFLGIFPDGTKSYFSVDW